MDSFTTNKIYLDSDTIAEQLRSARQEKGLKLNEVAKALKINQKYLDALEKNQFEKLPSGVYGKNFLKEYAIFLGLDHAEMLRIFEKEIGIEDKEKHESLFSAKVVKNLHVLAVSKIIRNLVILLVVVVCFVYLGIRLEKIVSPPFLAVDSPEENLITKEKTVQISGRTEAETQIVINGEQVLSDNKGNFYKKIDLKTGINIITISAKRKFGRESVIRRQILVKEEGMKL